MYWHRCKLWSIANCQLSCQHVILYMLQMWYTYWLYLLLPVLPGWGFVWGGWGRRGRWFLCSPRLPLRRGGRWWPTSWLWPHRGGSISKFVSHNNLAAVWMWSSVILFWCSLPYLINAALSRRKMSLNAIKWLPKRRPGRWSLLESVNPSSQCVLDVLGPACLLVVTISPRMQISWNNLQLLHSWICRYQWPQRRRLRMWVDQPSSPECQYQRKVGVRRTVLSVRMYACVSFYPRGGPTCVLESLQVQCIDVIAVTW